MVGNGAARPNPQPVSKQPSTGGQPTRKQPSRRENLIYWGVVALGALPGLWLVWAFATNNLGADPVNTINNVTGRAAMILLLLCLSFTPLHSIFALHPQYRVRRALGLWSFAYAALHFLNFAGLDYGFDFQFMLADGVATKPFILAGLAALLLLTALAVTSNRWSLRRLGVQRWQWLHATIYLIAVLVILHFFWQAKVAERWEPLLYGHARPRLCGQGLEDHSGLRNRWC